MSNPRTYSLPAGYFPQLPTCVTTTSHDPQPKVCFGTGIDGWRVDLPSGERLHFPSDDAVKAYKLAHGYIVPWRYGTEPLHPMAR